MKFRILFLALSLTIVSSCEDKFLTENDESLDIEKRFSVDDLVDQLVHDTSFVRLFELSIMDNYLIQAYADEVIDTNDVWLIFDVIGIDYSDYPLTVLDPEMHPFDAYDDFIEFIENEFSDPYMVGYFDEIYQNLNDLRDSYHAELALLNPQDMEYVFSQAYYTLLEQNEQELVEFLFGRSGDCEKCFVRYDLCVRQVKRQSMGAFGAGISGGFVWSLLTGNPGPLFFGFVTGTVSGGWIYAIGMADCRDELKVCLNLEGCPPVGGGGGTGNWDGTCPECIIKK